MKRSILFPTILFALACNNVAAQNYSKAPNSYIYDIDLARDNNYGGLEIPVKKAYEMWASFEYLKTQNAATPIPSGTQTASLYWEDIPGLVKNLAIVPGADPSLSKIKIDLNNAKGKGNAVIAFKVNGEIYWTWHVWVTDNPENGVTYSQGFETDINNKLIAVQYMDRNLGAVSNSFLADDWHKSGGLMYQWGRKDPFPALIHKDSNFYEISGEVGKIVHKNAIGGDKLPVIIRPYNEIEKNIQHSVKHPIDFIINLDNTGNWFSSSRYKIAAASPNYETWDLWSDNAGGKNSNGNSSNAALRDNSRSYELKSALDPCPNGWRIPSYYGRETQNNNLSFYGRRSWGNDDADVSLRQLYPNAPNQVLDGIKIYPGLGMDFSNVQNGDRNIGMQSMSGNYVTYPNSVAPQAAPGAVYQDQASNAGLWSSTYGYDGARAFTIVSDAFRSQTSAGLHAIFNNQTIPSQAGLAVKCMKDPNLAQIGNFNTEYFVNRKTEFRDGLDNPNSYIVTNGQTVIIPVNKAFAVYNQYLSDNEMLPMNNLSTKVLWTSNPNLIGRIDIQINQADPKQSKIYLRNNPGETGNAVVVLTNGPADSANYWSWHIWVPEDDPTLNTSTYTTEATVATPYNFVGNTVSKSPALTTTFMDRNLGAISSDIRSDNANGLHYQWGRKDPLPNFADEKSVYFSVTNLMVGPTLELNGGNINREGIGKSNISYLNINASNYNSTYTKPYDFYGSRNSVGHLKIRENLKYSIQNPFFYLYQRNTGVLYDGGNHFGNDITKIKDWATDGRAQADTRWGHATGKSPFDPCPEGWRVPDVSSSNLYLVTKGTSPWYNGYNNDMFGNGITQDRWQEISTSYAGLVVAGKGWKFENSVYSIGNFPKDGIRGELGDNLMSDIRSGVWTASMADLNTGYALGMQFEDNKVQTGAGVYPQAGMSVRCAKDENRFYANNTTSKPQTVQKIVIPEIADSYKTNIYPNPFADKIIAKGVTKGDFKMYDMSGKLVKSGLIMNNEINTSGLLAGLYILKITDGDGNVITKKMLKK